jgi:hypothetical protein
MRVAVLAIFFGLSAWGHHSTAPYDMTKEVAVSGTVARFYWANPHGYIFLDSEAGERWTLEIESPNLLRHQGWTKDSLKPGDKITCSGARAKDPEKFAMKCFAATMPDGTRLRAQYIPEAPRGN